MKKIKLKDIEVQSFVTMKPAETRTVQGGKATVTFEGIICKTACGGPCDPTDICV